PRRLPMPPSTVATNAYSTGCEPIVGETSPVWATSRYAPIPASRPLIAKAVAITVFALTPRIRAIRKSSAAARIWTPVRVLARKSPSAASSAIVTPTVTTARWVMLSELTEYDWESHGDTLVPFGADP